MLLDFDTRWRRSNSYFFKIDSRFASNIIGDFQRTHSNRGSNTEGKRNKERCHNHSQCSTTSYQKLLQHLDTRKKQHECSQCFKFFPGPSALAINQRIHTGEKPYQCSQCGKTFSLMWNLEGHQSIHTGEKPYQCSQCGKAFSQTYHLKTHQRIHGSDALP